MTIVYGIFNICDCLAEAQHGMSKVNQFPWEFSDRVNQLKIHLKSIIHFHVLFKKIKN